MSRPWLLVFVVFVVMLTSQFEWKQQFGEEIEPTSTVSLKDQSLSKRQEYVKEKSKKPTTIPQPISLPSPPITILSTPLSHTFRRERSVIVWHPESVFVHFLRPALYYYSSLDRDIQIIGFGIQQSTSRTCAKDIDREFEGLNLLLSLKL
ncbi:hypothetical protein Gotur_011921, partial [Gossypium turneri]